MLRSVRLHGNNIRSPSPLGTRDNSNSPGAPRSNNDAGESTAKLESFLKYLIEKGFVDNDDDSSETIHRFLEIFEQFEGSDGEESSNSDDGGPERRGAASSKQTDPFETRAIFTLADFFKSLGPNEYYDIAQKVFSQWEKGTPEKPSDGNSDDDKLYSKLDKLAKIMNKYNKTA